MVASYPQVMQQLLQGNSEKARYSQVTVIHSHGLKHKCVTGPVRVIPPARLPSLYPLYAPVVTQRDRL
jgi:hypothetical protein